LRQIGVPAATAIPALVQGLKDPNPSICIDYLWALTAISSADDSSTLVHEIITLLSASQAQVKYTACYAAGSLGRAAGEAIPILEANLQDHDTFLQVASAWALVRISPEKPAVAEESIDPLIRGLTVSDARVRAEAATSLGLLGPLAQRAVSALAEIRNDTDEAVRSAGAKALQRIQHPSSSDPQQQRR
jgi:HEAT repeat protein